MSKGQTFLSCFTSKPTRARANKSAGGSTTFTLHKAGCFGDFDKSRGLALNNIITEVICDGPHGLKNYAVVNGRETNF